MTEPHHRKVKMNVLASVKSSADLLEKKQELSKQESVKSTVTKLKEHQSKPFTRHILTACKLILVVLIVPPFLNYAALQREGTVLKPEGELYDVGWGQKLFLSCQGKGPPTVVLDAPTGMNSDAWALVVDKLVNYSRVCVYDRAGLGFSDRPYKNSTEHDGTESRSNYRNRWNPFTAERMVDDLHQLITRSSDQPKPFLLVGAELGALIAQFYARMFESDVMGLVLVNPLSDDLFLQEKGLWVHNWFGHLVPSFQTIQLSAALGLTRLAIMLGYLQQPMFMLQNASDDTVKRQKYLMCHPRHMSSVVDEHYFINETFSQFRTAKMIKSTIADNIAVTVVTGKYYDNQMPGLLNKAWAKSEQNLISTMYPHCQHVVINGGDRHMLYQKPEAIVEPIRKAIENWRSKQ